MTQNLERKLPLMILAVALCAAPGLLAQEEPQLLQPGAEGIDGSALQPFHAKYRQLQKTPDGEQEAGHRLIHLQEAQYPGGAGLRHVITMLGPATVYDEVQFLRSSFQPVARRISALSMLHQTEIFDGSTVRGFRISKDGTQADPVELTMEGERFASSTVDLVLAGQPLKVGYQAHLPIFSSDLGPQGANLYASVKVTGQEKVTVAGKERDAWVVETQMLDSGKKALQLGGQPFPTTKTWLSPEPPYLLKSEMGPLAVELVELQN